MAFWFSSCVVYECCGRRCRQSAHSSETDDSTWLSGAHERRSALRFCELDDFVVSKASYGLLLSDESGLTNVANGPARKFMRKGSGHWRAAYLLVDVQRYQYFVQLPLEQAPLTGANDCSAPGSVRKAASGHWRQSLHSGPSQCQLLERQRAIHLRASMEGLECLPLFDGK